MIDIVIRLLLKAFGTLLAFDKDCPQTVLDTLQGWLSQEQCTKVITVFMQSYLQLCAVFSSSEHFCLFHRMH